MVKLGIVMDPIATINTAKDSSFAMLLEAQSRGWEIYYMEMDELFLQVDVPAARMRGLSVRDSLTDFYQLQEVQVLPLADLDVILMRKDPPFNMHYVYATYFLELAQRQGTLVVNDPAALRDANEKFFISWFPQCTVPVLVTSRAEQIMGFLDEHKDIILKPLDGMGGAGIFRLVSGDQNAATAIDLLSQGGAEYVMAQVFIPQISDGDKRILMIDGEPLDYALARVPKQGDIRGNLVAGASAKGVELSSRDRWICGQLADTLREKGLLFVGIDVIGDYLTEINVTSPTCIRELDAMYDLNVAGNLMDVVAAKIA